LTKSKVTVRCIDLPWPVFNIAWWNCKAFTNPCRV